MAQVAAMSTHAALADEIRALGELVATHELEEDAASIVRAELSALRSRLAAGAARVRCDRAGGLPRWPVERSAISGALNPYAPPLRVDEESSELVSGTMSYPRALQGPPEHAHGGHLAMVFDHLAGRAATSLGVPVVTGRLAVRYLRPTPVGRPLRFEARVRETRHTLVTVDCAVFDGETRTATAEITFVQLGPSHFEQVFAALGREN